MKIARTFSSLVILMRVNVYGAQESIPGLLKSIKILSQLPPITEIPNHIQYMYVYPTRLNLILIVDEI